MNKKCFAVVVTEAEVKEAGQTLASFTEHAPEYEKFLVIVDGDESEKETAEFETTEIIYAQQLMDRKFYKYAFTFLKEEFEGYVGLSAVSRFLKEGYDTVILTNADTKINASIDVLEKHYDREGICFLKHEVAAEQIFENRSESFISEENLKKIYSFIIFNNGEKTKKLIQWCLRRYSYVYNNSQALYITRDSDKVDRVGGLCTLEEILSNNMLFTDVYHTIPGEDCIEVVNSKEEGEYRYDRFSDGTIITDMVRSACVTPYVVEILLSDNPFNDRKLLLGHTALYEDHNALPVTFVMETIYRRRLDLQVVLKNYDTTDRENFCRWFVNSARDEYDLPEEYIAPVRQALAAVTPNNKLLRYTKKGFDKVGLPQKHHKYPFGVNLCGYIRGNFGLAEACRLMAKTLKAADIPFTIIDYRIPQHVYTNNTWEEYISNQFIYNTNICVAGGSGCAAFPMVTGKDVYRDRYNIGYTYWELPEADADIANSFGYLDEVWTGADFCKEAFMAVTDKPVNVMPLSMDVPVNEKLKRADFGLPEDKFIFLMMYDVSSVSMRKNPEAVLKAFEAAFSESEDVLLLIKMYSPVEYLHNNEILNKAKSKKNIMVINKSFDKPDVNALISCCDAFVSLHRSEGLGLGPAEAMYLGKPAIMTGWSGNMEYATKENSCLVDYEIIEIDKDYPPYMKGCHWAEPSIEDASKYMRRLYEDKEYYGRIAQAGYKTMHEDYDGKVLGERMLKRLKTVAGK